MDLLKPHTAERVERKQLQQKAAHDAKAKSRTFRVGDKVYAKNFGTGKQWLPGEITGTTGPVSYTVRLEDGRDRRCHVDQLRTRIVEEDTQEMSSLPLEDCYSNPPTQSAGQTVPESTERNQSSNTVIFT